ncbi:RNA recognition motif domain-containing protein [Pedobacter sp. JCM 36344]|uniref:RNA recognition motif domain-containing protein n=1 Tax=Pedobacter sp. JCM 36344 TaxID=3374280 RepID=UPI00397A9378
MIKLFVVGFPLDIDDAELIELFAVQGLVHSAHFITDKFTNKHKGFAFIEMEDQVGADQAIAKLNGVVLRGRKITVKLADEDRVQKPRVFKPNRFEGDTKDISPDDIEFSTKRPRRINLKDKKG